MDGRKTLGMKMNYSFDVEDVFADKISKDIKAKDLIELNTIYQDQGSYLVLNVSRTNLSIKALPLSSYMKSFDEAYTIPILDIPFYMIKSYKTLDKSKLLFLINQDNPHILNAIKSMAKI